MALEQALLFGRTLAKRPLIPCDLFHPNQPLGKTIPTEKRNRAFKHSGLGFVHAGERCFKGVGRSEEQLSSSSGLYSSILFLTQLHV